MLARIFWAFILLSCAVDAESLETVLKRSGIPTASIPTAELHHEITSYAINPGDPFLLAYYDDNGTNFLGFPLRIIRYDRSHRLLTKSALYSLQAPFLDMDPAVQNDCLGSVLRVNEQYGRIYVNTHINPSAGCILVFSSQFALEALLSGWVVAVLGPHRAVLHENEIHFASVHPMRLKVVDFDQRSTIQIYPSQPDPLREQYSQQLQRHMPPDRWCMQTNSQCDPQNFDAELDGPVSVDTASQLFSFTARFDSGGFGPDAERSVPPERATYVYYFKDGKWQHRETRADTK